MDEQQKTIARMSLDELLGTSDFNQVPDEIENSNDSNDILVRSKGPSKFKKVQENSLIKAKKIMNTLLRFYLTENIIEEEEYIKASIELKSKNLAALIFTLESSERAITILMDSIEDGDTHPRMFEVLAGLQKTILDIVKSQTIYLMAAEEGMKKMSRDLDIYKNNNTSGKDKRTSISGNVTTRGTKDLMRSIKEEEGLKTNLEDNEL